MFGIFNGLLIKCVAKRSSTNNSCRSHNTVYTIYVSRKILKHLSKSLISGWKVSAIRRWCTMQVDASSHNLAN